jgi:hypothetical protein
MDCFVSHFALLPRNDGGDTFVVKPFGWISVFFTTGMQGSVVRCGNDKIRDLCILCDEFPKESYRRTKT